MGYASDLLTEQHQQIDRLVRVGNVAALRKLYAQAIAEMQGKLAAVLLRGKSDSYTAHVHRQMLLQLREGVLELTKRFGEGLALTAQETAVESLAMTLQNIKRLNKHYAGAEVTLALEQSAIFWGVIDKRTTSLLSVHPGSVARYGTTLVTEMEGQLALSVAQGETGFEAMRRIEKTADINWWRAERIVRTETAWAANSVTADGVASAAQDLPGMMLRWTELIDDTTGRPFDDRVAADSFVMHGQLARPGGVFTMPVDERVASDQWGKTWNFPPNRPQDRSSALPWRPHWGVPGWRYLQRRRVPVPPQVVAER